MSPMKRLIPRCILILTLLAPAAALGWPNGPDEDPRLDPPNDPGFNGQWNLWSHFPDAWAAKIESPAQVALGPGIHADRAWQVTPGDRRVLIAVLDSGCYWDNRDLVNKYYLNAKELAGCMPKPIPGKIDPPGAGFDVDGSGWLDIRDYWAGYENEAAALADWDENSNGMLDPQDLILKCSDGVDDDGNGYIDDISGWDFLRDDNDAYDDNRYGHGNGEARDSCGEGNNGIGDIGVCPGCTALMVRVGDSFVADSNDFGQGVVFAVDSGASVVQEALGTVNNTALSRTSIDYAYDNNVAIIASAADELSFHHNMPGTYNHTIYVHAIQHDQPSASQSKTFLNFNNCTNFGMQLLLSTPGTGCSSEAVGITAGHAGLMYSAGLKADLDPPLSAEEMKQIMTHPEGMDEIAINPNDDDPTKFPSAEGFDWHFGYGRNNARKTVDMIVAKRIPPEVDIVTPHWFQVLYPDRTAMVEIVGRINMRRDGLAARFDEVTWKLEYALGVAPDEKKGDAWTEVASGTTTGTEGVLATWDISKVQLDLDALITDSHQNSITLRLRATGELADGSMITGEHRKGFHLEKDPTLLQGFPIDLGASSESSPSFADLDGDKIQELIVMVSDGRIHAFKADGSQLAGFPVSTQVRRAVNPGNANNVRNSCAFRADKTDCEAQVGQLDVDVRETVMLAPAVGDLDGDGDLEIVTMTWDGYAYVFEHTGELRPGFPVGVDRSKSELRDGDHIVDAGFMAAPVLYDLDGDGDLEIVGAAMDQHIYVWEHDGSTFAPYPVRVSDVPVEESAERIITTPAIGDLDGDGTPEIAVGTNEALGAGGAQNEAKAYVIEAETGAIREGWPVPLYGLMVDVLPIVGRGVPTNPIMADLDFDGKLELSFDTIASSGNILREDGSPFATMNNRDFGKGSDSEDSPAYILMNNGAIGYVDRTGGLDLIKGTAGFDFALAFAGGGERGYFDHHVSGWDTDTKQMLEGFPRVIEDWQFFNTPSIVDLDNDNDPEVIIGSAGYLVHAWNYKGVEAPGFPKQTGGWIIASVAVGEFDGDGKFEVAVTTRNGWLYVWDTEGEVGSIFEWNGYGHDPHNTNNYEMPATPYQTWSNDPVGPEPDAGGGEDVAGTPDAGPTDTGPADTGPATDNGAGSDDTGVTATDSGPSPTDGGGTTTTGTTDDGGCATKGTSPIAPAALGGLMLIGWAMVRRRRA